MRRVTTAERRARLVRRQRLDPPRRADSVADVARSLVALHSTDPVSVYLSVRARSAALDPAAIERELYEERTVARMLGMRRTLFVVPRDLRPVVQAACADEIAVRERKRLLGWLAATPGIRNADAWLAEAEDAALAALEHAGQASTTELVRAVDMLGTKVEVGSGRWAITQSAGARILPVLAAQGRLLRGRPRGTWISGQYRWVLPRAWLGGEQAAAQADEAREQLVAAWLSAFGPGTETDLRWWTGLGARPVRAALAAIGAVDVELESGGTGSLLPDDLEETEPPEPAAALLPTLDPTTMGWKERDWYLGPHASVLFDSNGNAGPTVWWDGRIVGGWSQRPDGEIAHRLLEDVGRDAAAAVEEEAARLAEWLGDVRFTPGFLPPFHRSL